MAEIIIFLTVMVSIGLNLFYTLAVLPGARRLVTRLRGRILELQEDLNRAMDLIEQLNKAKVDAEKQKTTL